MAIKFGDLWQETRTINVALGSGTLEVVYRPNAYTPQLEEELANAETKPARTLANILRQLVVHWDLETDSGEMYPLDAEHIAQLPLQFMLTVFAAIAEDMRPNLPSAGG